MLLLRIIRWVRKTIFIRLNIFFSIIVFYFKKTILGFENANKYLSSIDKSIVFYLLKLNGATVGENCDIERGIVFHNCSDYRNLIIGNNCHIGKECFFDLKDKIILHDNVVISMRTVIITHLDMSRSLLNTIYPKTHSPVVIESDVYIGASCTVLQGVTLRKSCCIGAGSLVNKDVGEGLLYGGVPAVFIKKII